MLEMIILLFLGAWGLIFVFQRYLESGRVVYLFMLLGTIIVAIGLSTAFIFEYFGYFIEDTWVEYIVIIPGLILSVIGFYFIPVNVAISDIVKGRIPSPRSYNKPSLSRKIGMLIGFMGITGGIVKCYKTFSSISNLGIALIIFGSLIFLVSIIDFKGEKGNKKIKNSCKNEDAK